MGESVNDDFGIPTAPSNTPMDDRQHDRMALVPEIYKTTHERLAVELALKMDEPADIFARYGYSVEQAAALLDSVAFQVMMARIAAEVAQNGLSFKAKIRAIAEDLLPTAHALATDPLTSAAVRADLIKWAGKMAGHEPKEDKEVGKGVGGLNLSITFAGQAPMKVVENSPLTIEQA